MKHTAIPASTGPKTTTAATISHCFQIGTLPIRIVSHHLGHSEVWNR